MKNLKITIGAITLISALLLGITLQIKAANFIKNLYSTPSLLNTTPTPPDNQENTVQLALLLDTSGSMNGLIEQTKSQLWKIVNELTTFKKNGETPELEIALYEFGTQTRSDNSKGWIRQISNFTPDMDKISEELFALTTGGSAEYCGMVMQNSLNDLQWNQSENALRVIYIAGNESFAQGPVDYREVAKFAKAKGIFVNTIFCGDEASGINLNWQSGAMLAGGDFASIDHNQQTVYIETPYDQSISDLNGKLNETYIAFGKKGQKYLQNQRMQDTNAGSYSMANVVERTAFKTSKNYNNANWDLVDAYKNNSDLLSDNDKMPTELKDKSVKERAKIIEEKTAKRATIQNKIQELNRQRKQYIAQQASKGGEESLENSMIYSIRKQAKTKGFSAEELAKIELQSSLVDYPEFLKLTTEIEPYRQKRMVSFKKFLKMANDPNTIILDTRSESAYKMKHLKGAVHLSFSDFTEEKLAKIIPSKNTRILIYCNNNILGDPINFASKAMPLALNVPTFINLYGYGYQNIYELESLVPVDHELLEFEGLSIGDYNN